VWKKSRELFRKVHSYLGITDMDAETGDASRELMHEFEYSMMTGGTG
jgi:hypothetical protein